MKACLILLLLALALQTSSLSCGGNCPTDTCEQCPCGNQTNYINVNDYCNLMTSGTNASINCCKCIIQITSKGNEKYSEEYSKLRFERIGIIPYPLEALANCPNPTESLCNWKQNADCVRRVYREYNAWWIWE